MRYLYEPFIPESWAEDILHALEVCFNEGIGPSGKSTQAMVDWIVVTYPELAKFWDHVPEVKEAFKAQKLLKAIS